MATATATLCSGDGVTVSLTYDTVTTIVSQVAVDNPGGKTVTLTATNEATGKAFGPVTVTTSATRSVPAGLGILYDHRDGLGARRTDARLSIQVGVS